MACFKLFAFSLPRPGSFRAGNLHSNLANRNEITVILSLQQTHYWHFEITLCALEIIGKGVFSLTAHPWLPSLAWLANISQHN